MSDVPILGQLIHDVAARRDCVHVAVAPVEAGEPLDPGDHVELDEAGLAVKPGRGVRTAGTIGVVDPFFSGVVTKGERFWLLLYQNSVTGMRHLWSHPAFVKKAPEGE